MGRAGLWLSLLVKEGKMARPDYCGVVDADDLAFPIGPHRPCPACGATVEGKDPVRGVCQAQSPYPKPEPLVRLVLTHRDTGELI